MEKLSLNPLETEIYNKMVKVHLLCNAFRGRRGLTFYDNSNKGIFVTNVEGVSENCLNLKQNLYLYLVLMFLRLTPHQ